MKKILFTLATALCIMTTAMAQTTPAVSGKDSDSIPQRNLTQMSLDSMQNEDARCNHCHHPTCLEDIKEPYHHQSLRQ